MSGSADAAHVPATLSHESVPGCYSWTSTRAHPKAVIPAKAGIQKGSVKCRVFCSS